MEVFYTPKKNIGRDGLTIIGEEARHIGVVLKHKRGDRISVTDGEGFEYPVIIDNITKNTVYCKILSKVRKPRESLVHIALAQGVIKGQRMDILVEKATELGVFEIIPLITERSVARLKGKERLDRLKRVALSAMKTSTRSLLPKIYEPMEFEDALKLSERYDISLLAWEGEKKNRLQDIIKENPKKVMLFIGPEGGFTEEEVERAKKRVEVFSLGPRRLRSETAGIAAVSLLLYQLGEM